MKKAEERTRDFVRGKEAAALTDERRRRDSKNTPQWKKEAPYQGLGGPRRRRNEWSGEERRSRPPIPYDISREENKRVFTTLVKTPCEILATEAVAKKFNPPTPGKNMKGPADRFCEYHQGTGHNTNDCFQLKRKIEEAVQSGELAHLVKNIRTTNGGSNPNARKYKVNMVSMGSNAVRPIDLYQDWMRAPITFRQEERWGLTNEALVISARTRETPIERILIDTGAATGVIYAHFFHKLPGRVKESAIRTDINL
jgi:hypothetical protein